MEDKSWKWFIMLLSLPGEEGGDRVKRRLLGLRWWAGGEAGADADAPVDREEEDDNKGAFCDETCDEICDKTCGEVCGEGVV